MPIIIFFLLGFKSAKIIRRARKRKPFLVYNRKLFHDLGQQKAHSVQYQIVCFLWSLLPLQLLRLYIFIIVTLESVRSVALIQLLCTVAIKVVRSIVESIVYKKYFNAHLLLVRFSNPASNNDVLEEITDDTNKVATDKDLDKILLFDVSDFYDTSEISVNVSTLSIF